MTWLWIPIYTVRSSCSDFASCNYFHWTFTFFSSSHNALLFFLPPSPSRCAFHSHTPLLPCTTLMKNQNTGQAPSPSTSRQDTFSFAPAKDPIAAACLPPFLSKPSSQHSQKARWLRFTQCRVFARIFLHSEIVCKRSLLGILCHHIRPQQQHQQQHHMHDTEEWRYGTDDDDDDPRCWPSPVSAAREWVDSFIPVTTKTSSRALFQMRRDDQITRHWMCAVRVIGNNFKLTAARAIWLAANLRQSDVRRWCVRYVMFSLWLGRRNDSKKFSKSQYSHWKEQRR